MERETYKALAPDEADVAAALGVDPVEARTVITDLYKAGYLIMRGPRRTTLASFSEAVRTGDYRQVTDWDWRAFLAAVHAGFVTEESLALNDDDIARLARTVPLTQAAVTAGIEALERGERPY